VASPVKINFKYFFDRPAVKQAVDKGTRKALSKWGAYVRTAAKSSIRKRKKSSAPGQPPSSHQGSLKKLIFFAFDPGRESVVAGPLSFGKNPGADVLEYGGMHSIFLRQPRRNDGTRGPSKTIRVKYRAFPFMGPAEEQVRGELPNIWRNSIK